jgi:ABC-type Fe3+/spermidine/putrescine transport system ATPase subunit
LTDSDPSSPAVEFRTVRKRFGKRTVLDGVDLAIGRGEVFVLVGPSGGGKSTALKMVSGIDSPDAGAVWLNGRDVTALPPYRRAVHTVFQNYALFPHLNVSQNVAFPLSVKGVAAAECNRRVQEALGWVRMQKHSGRRIAMLSGGEKQRVALARALVNEPQCLLLDEPLSALDPHLRAATLELLQDIQSRLNVTYLYITHDREEALRIADRIGVLNRGRLEQVGSPEEIYQRPRTAFVASFFGRMNWLRGELQSSGGLSALRLASGEIVPLASAAPPSSSAVKLGVRPEDMRLGGVGLLEAQVIGRQFFGPSVLVRMVAKDGSPLVANVREPLPDVDVGSRVSVSWPAAAAHLYAADAEEANE